VRVKAKEDREKAINTYITVLYTQGRVEGILEYIGGVYLPSQLECTLQLCT
jgi:hypothetical protein